MKEVIGMATERYSFLCPKGESKGIGESIVYGSRFMNRGSSVPKSTLRPPMNLESSGDTASKRSQSISSNIIDQEKG